MGVAPTGKSRASDAGEAVSTLCSKCEYLGKDLCPHGRPSPGPPPDAVAVAIEKWQALTDAHRDHVSLILSGRVASHPEAYEFNIARELLEALAKGTP
jgi:hypothetical protein